MRHWILCCLTVLVSATTIHAQGTQTDVSNTSPDNDRRQVVPFLDATYVAFARATGDQTDRAEQTDDAVTTFEADIVPNFVVRQTFFDVLGQEETKSFLRRTQQKSLFSEFRFAYSIVAVPMVKLRMFVKERSSPVRTPSYMPKGTGQLFWFKLQEQKVDLFAAQATVGHHSNGQDGCLFKIQERESEDSDADCIPEIPADRTPSEINRRDGSFSTNYLQFGWRYRHIVLDPAIKSEKVAQAEYMLQNAVRAGDWPAVLEASARLRTAAGLASNAQELVDGWEARLRRAVAVAAENPKSDAARDAIIDASVALVAAANPVLRTSSHDVTLGVDLELNPGDGRFLGGAGIDPELKSRYGATRVTLLGGIAARIKGCDRAEGKGSAKYIHRPTDGVPSWAWSVEGQCLFRQTNWGLFARFYSGQDYYNLAFVDDVRRLQVGMTYSQEGFLRFRAKPVSAAEAREASGK
jgi:hypothetical protein